MPLLGAFGPGPALDDGPAPASSRLRRRERPGRVLGLMNSATDTYVSARYSRLTVGTRAKRRYLGGARQPRIRFVGAPPRPVVWVGSQQPGPMDVSRRVPLLDGAEPFFEGEGREVASVLDFGRWSSSDLVGNSFRGVLAEFLVGRALGVDPHNVRVEWDAWDLVTVDGTTVEVKSASYWQSWKQVRPSDIRFDLAEHQSWTSETDTFDEGKSRPADVYVYVFCVLDCRDNPNVDPLDLSE